MAVKRTGKAAGQSLTGPSSRRRGPSPPDPALTQLSPDLRTWIEAVVKREVDAAFDRLRQSRRADVGPLLQEAEKNKKKQKVNHHPSDHNIPSPEKARLAAPSPTTGGEVEKIIHDPSWLSLIESPLSDEILRTTVPPEFSFPEITPYDGLTDPCDHVWRHVVSMYGRSRSDQIHCLLFPATLTGEALRRFNSIPKGSITNFRQLQEQFIGRYLGRCRCSRRFQG